MGKKANSQWQMVNGKKWLMANGKWQIAKFILLFTVYRLLFTVCYLLFTVYYLLFAIYSPVHAFTINEDIFPFAKNFKTLAAVVNTLLANIFLIAGLGILVIGVMAGFKVLTGAGSGDAKATEQGKRALTYAIAGIVIIFTSLFVVQLIEFLTGIKILNPTL